MISRGAQFDLHYNPPPPEGVRRSGAHGGTTYSGQYADLGAAVAAILLDREARSPTLDLDPSHGQLREPLLRVLPHAARSHPPLAPLQPRHGRRCE